MSKAGHSATQCRQSTEDEVSGPNDRWTAHAGSHDVGLRLHDESKVAFRIMDDEAVEDTDKAKM